MWPQDPADFGMLIFAYTSAICTTATSSPALIRCGYHKDLRAESVITISASSVTFGYDSSSPAVLMVHMEFHAALSEFSLDLSLSCFWIHPT